MWWLIVGIVCGIGAGFFIRDRTRTPQIVSVPVVAEPVSDSDSEAEKIISLLALSVRMITTSIIQKIS